MSDKRKSHPSIYRQCSRADDNHAEKHLLFEVPLNDLRTDNETFGAISASPDEKRHAICDIHSTRPDMFQLGTARQIRVCGTGGRSGTSRALVRSAFSPLGAIAA